MKIKQYLYCSYCDKEFTNKKAITHKCPEMISQSNKMKKTKLKIGKTPSQIIYLYDDGSWMIEFPKVGKKIKKKTEIGKRVIIKNSGIKELPDGVYKTKEFKEKPKPYQRIIDTSVIKVKKIKRNQKVRIKRDISKIIKKKPYQRITK